MTLAAMGIHTPTHGLGWLLHPLMPTEFFISYWEKRPLQVKRGDPTYYLTLPGLAEVDGLITTTIFGANGKTVEGRLVRTERDGALSQHPFRLDANGIPDIHHIYRSYDEGYTIVLNGLHRRSATIAALCRELETECHHTVGANLYLTPRSAQGFRPHVDSHDVLILQIHGEKSWRVGATPARQLPTAEIANEPIEAILEADDYVLTPGDALYIPRGYAHEAITQLSSSLHLTVGIHPFTWADLLSEALRIVAAEDASLRRALPVDHFTTAFREDAVCALRNSIAGLTSNSVLEAARVSLSAKLLQRNTATAGHFSSLDCVSELGVDTVLTRGFRGPCRVRAIGEGVIADYPGNYLSVPQFLAPALEYAASTRQFTLGSIPGDLTDSERIEFVARLISEGFLSIVNKRMNLQP